MKTARYGTYKNPSIKTTLLTKEGPFNRRYVLIHSTSGFEPAGSMARWTDERYSVGFFDQNGTFYGQSFKDETAARAHYNKIGNM